MKPLLNLRPVVMLGAPGALAIAESHGFNVTLGTLVDASYDRVLKREARVAAALDEADRLSRLPPPTGSPPPRRSSPTNATSTAAGLRASSRTTRGRRSSSRWR